MRKVNINMLKSGMILKEDLYNQHGAVIIPKGVKITAEHLELLKSWRIVYAPNVEKEEEKNGTKRDSYTYQHSINVAIYASLIAKWMCYDGKSIKEISKAAILHDIGKMKVPEEILNKPGKLTLEEFEEVKKHSEYGYNMIFKTDNLGKDVALRVLQHHERNNGSGYPLGG